MQGLASQHRQPDADADENLAAQGAQVGDYDSQSVDPPLLSGDQHPVAVLCMYVVLFLQGRLWVEHPDQQKP